MQLEWEDGADKMEKFKALMARTFFSYFEYHFFIYLTYHEFLCPSSPWAQFRCHPPCAMSRPAPGILWPCDRETKRVEKNSFVLQDINKMEQIANSLLMLWKKNFFIALVIIFAEKYKKVLYKEKARRASRAEWVESYQTITLSEFMIEKKFKSVFAPLQNTSLCLLRKSWEECRHIIYVSLQQSSGWERISIFSSSSFLSLFYLLQ